MKTYNYSEESSPPKAEAARSNRARCASYFNSLAYNYPKVCNDNSGFSPDQCFTSLKNFEIFARALSESSPDFTEAAIGNLLDTMTTDDGCGDFADLQA